MKLNPINRPVRVHHVQTGEDGFRLAVHEWPGEGASTSLPTVVFLHGTGFHARCWDRIIVELPRSIRCLSIDQVRGLLTNDILFYDDSRIRVLVLHKGRIPRYPLNGN